MFDLLDGLRVLDLGTGVSGPYCAKLLLDAGASVVRVEPPGGDPLRGLGPPVEDGAGAAFAFCNAGKQSVVLDYTQPDGARRLWELLRWADVVIENEAPGVLAATASAPTTCSPPAPPWSTSRSPATARPGPAATGGSRNSPSAPPAAWSTSTAPRSASRSPIPATSWRSGAGPRRPPGRWRRCGTPAARAPGSTST